MTERESTLTGGEVMSGHQCKRCGRYLYGDAERAAREEIEKLQARVAELERDRDLIRDQRDQARSDFANQATHPSNPLQARVAELEAAVESAFREGWLDGHGACGAAFALEPTWTEDAAWAESEARAALEGK